MTTIIFPSFVQNNLQNFFKKNKSCIEKYCDITFIIGDIQIHSIKILLASCSDVFRVLLFGDFKESKEKIIVIKKDVDSEAFKKFIDICMFGKAVIPYKYFLSVLFLANEYGIEKLEKKMSDEIKKCINEDNVLDFYESAVVLKNKDVEERCFIFLKSNLKKVILQEKVKKLSEESFIRIFDNIFLSNVSQKVLVDQILNWANYHYQNDKEKKEILEKNFLDKYVDFKAFTPEELNEYCTRGVITTELLVYVLSVKLSPSFKPSTPINLNCRTVTNTNIYGMKGSYKGFFEYDKLIIGKFVGSGIPVNYNDPHDGGTTFDDVRRVYWSIFGNENRENSVDDKNGGNVLHFTHIESKKTGSITLPFQTHGSYPLFDGEKYIYIIQSVDHVQGKRFIKVDVETKKIEELCQSPFSIGGFTIPCIQNKCIYTNSNDDGKIIYYCIQSDKWRNTNIILPKKRNGFFSDPLDTNKIWIFDGKDIRLFNITDDTCTLHYSTSYNSTLNSNFIGFIILVESNGYPIPFLFILYNEQTHIIVDLKNKKKVNVKDIPINSHASGHWIVDHDKKSIYIRPTKDESWKVMKLDQ